MAGFSDGVFSIAITLLVLEIGVPAGSETHLLQALVAEWPSYLAYLVSFATIGAVWFGHTVITEYLDQANSMLIRLNLLLLLLVSFLPFPTRLLAEYTEEREAERVAATVYGINLLLALVLLSVLVSRSSHSPRSASSWRTHWRIVSVPIPSSRATSAIVPASEDRYTSIARALNSGENLLGLVTISSSLGQSDQDREPPEKRGTSGPVATGSCVGCVAGLGYPVLR
jgi:uncharacterized membrane protein